MKSIFVITESLKGNVSDITFEMLGKGREIADQTGSALVSVCLCKNIETYASQLGVSDSILAIEHDAFQDYNPEASINALSNLIRVHKPWLILIGATSMGLDLAAPLAMKIQSPCITSINQLTQSEGKTIVTSQQYGGKILVDVELQGESNILSILPGSFSRENGISDRTVPIEKAVADLPDLRMKFERMIEPDAGDIDITQVPILVSVGRGIQSQDNLAMAEELATALGGAVSASRPVVDQGWLPMTRQIGRSGMIVKPKVYLALGISGAPEHVEGMRSSELIIAVNTDPQAPIFETAHYGAVCDVLDILPALASAVQSQP